MHNTVDPAGAEGLEKSEVFHSCPRSQAGAWEREKREKIKTTAVSIREKYILAAIASQHDMIESAGIMDTGLTCHGGTLRK
jgi:hypothetical protein